MEEEIKDTKSDEHSRDYSVKLLLFFGFCGIIGLLTTAIIGIPLPFAFVFVVFAGVGLPCGLIRLTKKERKIKPIVISLIASILLLPVYIPIGIGIGFLAPLLPSYVKIFFTGPNVVQSVMSPDGPL
ncbi:MAG: hypothetical protein ACYTFW_24845 [Planctomycetota bacterium]|jgi:hypothetical protein